MNSRKGEGAMVDSDWSGSEAAYGWDQETVEAGTFRKGAIRLPEAFRHWVHWQTWEDGGQESGVGNLMVYLIWPHRQPPVMGWWAGFEVAIVRLRMLIYKYRRGTEMSRLDVKPFSRWNASGHFTKDPGNLSRPLDVSMIVFESPTFNISSYPLYTGTPVSPYLSAALSDISKIRGRHSTPRSLRINSWLLIHLVRAHRILRIQQQDG